MTEKYDRFVGVRLTKTAYAQLERISVNDGLQPGTVARVAIVQYLKTHDGGATI